MEYFMWQLNQASSATKCGWCMVMWLTKFGWAKWTIPFLKRFLLCSIVPEIILYFNHDPRALEHNIFF